jgi:hypothetical protein
MSIKGNNILYLPLTEIKVSCDPPKIYILLCDLLLIGIKVNFDYFIQ